jgi:hypothetical protein
VIEILDMYCERTGQGLGNEPLNAVTNLAFIIAGAVALRQWRNAPQLGWRNSWDLLLLIVLLFAIGVGSALWHTLATRWAMYADEIPILIFINVYLLAFLVRIARLRWLGTLACFALFQVLNRAVGSAFPRDFLNGSVFYAPAWATLAAMAICLAVRKDRSARDFALAAALFTVSLFFRTVDEAVCPALPIGTHFVWHVCNAVMLYLLLRALIRSTAKPV